MRIPRFRVRTLMIAVAVAALALVVVPPSWRYWFQSPWRVVTWTDYRFIRPWHLYEAEKTTAFFDMRKPGDVARFRKAIKTPRTQAANLTVERYTTFPRNRFPTFTDDDIREIDPPEPK